MRLRPRNPALLERLVPFVVATAATRERLNLRPLGIAVAEDCVLDPLRSEATALLRKLRALDAATFGPEGMPMPRWILLDGAGLTGVIFGLGVRDSQAGEDVRRILELDAVAGGVVPYSMYIGIPSFERRTWVGHNLASLAVRSPRGEDLRGLGSLTKALALSAMGARFQLGATQWDSNAVRVHVRMGALELLTAWTPAHTKPWTFTYRVRVDSACLLHLARDPRGLAELPAPQRWLDPADHASMSELQQRIEAGERWCVAGAPRRTPGGCGEVPLARTPAFSRSSRLS